MAKLLSHPQDIDLAKHGVIEAHAGTGKTYTIVQLVLRLLKGEGNRPPLPISKLLLVTYTDKAAGELKERIREGLVQEIAKSPNAHLNDCLSNMGEALIGTIHSVCLRILRMWPFETGVHFQTQMVNDKHGIEEAFYDLVRKEWNNEESILCHAIGWMKSAGIAVESKYVDGVKELALQLLDDQCVQLDRTAWNQMTLASFSCEQQENKKCQAQAWDAMAAAVDGFIQCMENIAKIPQCEESLRQALQEKAKDVRSNLRQKNTTGWSGLSKSNDKEMIGKRDPLYKQNESLCGEFRELWPSRIKDALSVIKEQKAAWKQKSSLLDLLFVAESAEHLARIWRNKKSEQGLISFNDMLRSTHRAVLENPVLVQQIREKVTFGIIDEFQDTSVLQWQIFREIFLHGGEGKLFIVGDPKQSIYAFQGADVGSYAQARSEILKVGGTLYGLIYNYRSLPNVISGYNDIVGKDKDKEDWFCHEAICYPGEGAGGQMALVPSRKESLPSHARATVTVIPLTGKTEERRKQMVEHVLHVVRSLCGTNMVLPKGDGWEERKLTLSDFAVIVENHFLGNAYLDRFAEEGVRIAKYKMDGVFQSEMCIALRSMLLAIGDSKQQQKMAALLTPFFQRHPANLDPDKDLGLESPLMNCLTVLGEHAERRRWGMLFEDLLSLTSVETTLARLGDGERRIADLRQVIDYSMEKLVQNNWSLHELCDHLQALIEKRDDAGQDQNLFNLATERDAVQVLSMHASKGLEFPVVFLELGNSERQERNIEIRQWNENGTKRVFPTRKDAPGWDDHAEASQQSRQERRRLLYVALTRPKAMLFVPLHIDEKNAEADLAPRLQELLCENRIAIYSDTDYPLHQDSPGAPTLDHLATDYQPEPDLEHAQRIKLLAMPSRYSLQTSYTELSHGMEHDREFSPAAELEPEQKAYKESALPRGKNTGDALHKSIEFCIRNADWQSRDLEKVVQEQLNAGSVLKAEQQEAGLAAAVRMVRQSMLSTYDLRCEWGSFRLVDLPFGHCRAELEFQLADGVDWLHGFMDVVFRLPDQSNPKHPWRYFVLDWKSNSLPEYSLPYIEKSIVESHYDLQAHVYSFALHRFLHGLLGDAYDPVKNLGGAVYVYLRAFEYGDSVPVWMHKAIPEKDGAFVDNQMNLWKKKKRPWTT